MYKLALFLCLSSPAFAFEYFNQDIDYWNKSPPNLTKKPDPPKPIPPKNKSFDWDKYLDPSNDEFFVEGNHKPPAPLMELARNPTDENMKNWFAMMEKKNELMARLNQHMAAYLAKNKKQLKPKEKEVIKANIEKATPVSIAKAKRFRFRLYFDSTCPHCKNMMKTAKDLQDLGYYMEVRQIDRKPPTFPVPFASTPATKEEIEQRKITSWPVLFIGDAEKKLVYRINGYHPTQSILDVLRTK